MLARYSSLAATILAAPVSVLDAPTFNFTIKKDQ